MTQLIYVQGEAYVAGSSNGVRATVIAEGDIPITNSLIYASWTNKTMTGTQWEAYTSGDDTNLTEALGLISKSNIWVDTSCPTNMSVFAHVMATGTNCGFGAASYDARKTGALTLFGGIVQYKRAAVGVGTNGFKKFYTYDTRFAINPPPYYPVQSETINYEQWEEHAP